MHTCFREEPWHKWRLNEIVKRSGNVCAEAETDDSQMHRTVPDDAANATSLAVICSTADDANVNATCLAGSGFSGQKRQD